MKAKTAKALDEWRAAVAETEAAKDAEGATFAEIMAAMGVTERPARAKFAKLKAAGRVVCAGRRKVTRADGRPDSVPVYKLVGAKGVSKG